MTDRRRTRNAYTADSPTVQIQKIGPGVAEKMLKTNYDNRRIGKKHVQSLRRKIKEGVWQFNGDPIRFSKYGKLLDGQHRLTAISQAGVTVRAVVVLGLEESSQETMDETRVRRPKHFLQMRGYTHCTTLAAMAKIFYFHIRYGLERLNNSGLNPDNSEVLNLVDDYPAMQESAKFGSRKAFTNMVSNRAIAFAHFVTNAADSDFADDWFEKMQTGVNVEKGTGLYHLLSRLTRDNRRIKPQVKQGERIALFLKALSKDYNSQSVKALRWPNTAGEAHPDLEFSPFHKSETDN